MTLPDGPRVALLAGVVYAGVAGGVVLAFDALAPTLAAPVLEASAVLSAFVVGASTWYVVVERADERTVFRGAVGGLLTGSLSHFTMWLFYGVALTPELFYVAPLFLTTGVPSLLVFGVVTVPLATATGAAVAVVESRTNESRAGVPDR
ncbi:hypothetical protein [Halomarina oriensis]|uniref:Uncharacterized protein n=1 Tax=Halomarina oriensis TaxID=671145 RepID=A0A6B0GU32_9EURY|nr:hypothetical protein [Halomarina oriensis]MWG36887.1 hypothetical protein [Halomarina oriensis]